MMQMQDIEGASSINTEKEEDLVENFLQSLPLDGTVVKLRTKSGLDEDLLLGLKVKENSKRQTALEQYLGGKIDELITVTLYAEGNGLLHEEGKLGIIGHRDLAVCSKPNGVRFIYSDKRTDDYLPSGEGLELDPNSISRFSGGSNTIERRGLNEDTINAMFYNDPVKMEQLLQVVKEKGDPYQIGLGAFMQSVGVDRAMRLGATEVKSNMISEDGRRIWEGLGIPVSPEHEAVKIDKNIVQEKIRKSVLSFI